jgi:hypothetical protein
MAVSDDVALGRIVAAALAEAVGSAGVTTFARPSPRRC